MTGGLPCMIVTNNTRNIAIIDESEAERAHKHAVLASYVSLCV